MLASDVSEAVEIMFLPLGVEAEVDKLVEKDICNQFPCPRLQQPNDPAEVVRARSQEP
jgi:hypothetical protein